MGVRQLRHPLQGVRHARGTPRTVQEKIADAAQVHRFTGLAPTRRPAHPVGPASTTTRRCAATPRTSGSGSARSTPTPSRTTTTSSAALTHADPRSAARPSTTTCECIEIMHETGSRDLKIWLADGTNYPGQDDIRGRQDRLADVAGRRSTPSSRRRPAAGAGVQVLRAGVLPHRRPGLGHVLRPGRRPRRARHGVPGHRPPRPGHEHRVHRRPAAAAGKARLVRLQLALLRRRRPDRRGGRSVPAVPDHARGDPRRWPRIPDSDVALMLDQCHNVEDKIPGQIRSVLERAGDDGACAARRRPTRSPRPTPPATCWARTRS